MWVLPEQRSKASKSVEQIILENKSAASNIGVKLTGRVKFWKTETQGRTYLEIEKNGVTKWIEQSNLKKGRSPFSRPQKSKQSFLQEINEFVHFLNEKLTSPVYVLSDTFRWDVAKRERYQVDIVWKKIVRTVTTRHILTKANPFQHKTPCERMQELSPLIAKWGASFTGNFDNDKYEIINEYGYRRWVYATNLMRQGNPFLHKTVDEQLIELSNLGNRYGYKPTGFSFIPETRKQNGNMKSRLFEVSNSTNNAWITLANARKGKDPFRNAFQENQRACLYILSIVGDKEKFVGYGISNTPRQRLKTHESRLRKNGLRIEKYILFEFFSGREAFKVEQSLIRKYGHKNIVIEGFRRENAQYQEYDLIVAELGKKYAFTNLANW